ncbi:hypothetical protein PtrSN002B_012248, partial [Pyrenophora tritici-repentis]
MMPLKHAAPQLDTPWAGLLPDFRLLPGPQACRVQLRVVAQRIRKDCQDLRLVYTAYVFISQL